MRIISDISFVFFLGIFMGILLIGVCHAIATLL